MPLAKTADAQQADAMPAENSPLTRPPHEAIPSAESVQRLVDALARLGADGEWLVDAFTEHVLSTQTIDRSTLQEEQRAVLIASGAFTAETIDEAQANVDRGSLILSEAESWLAAACSTSPLDETKRFLGIDDDELVSRIEHGELIAVKMAGRLRFPRWQFEASNPPSKTLRGLPEIVAALASNGEGWRRDAIFMTSPKGSLVAEAARSPIDWLRGGGNVPAVLSAIRSWGAW